MMSIISTEGLIKCVVVKQQKSGDGWISKDQCIELAKQEQVELEVCVSRLGNTYLRASPIGTFQDALDNLIDKKYKE